MTKFIYKLQSRTHDSELIGKSTDPVEFDIHENFWVQGTGLVVSGILKSGTLSTGGQYLIGPDKDSQFT